jgi:hypothetical protein
MTSGYTIVGTFAVFNSIPAGRLQGIISLRKASYRFLKIAFRQRQHHRLLSRISPSFNRNGQCQQCKYTAPNISEDFDKYPSVINYNREKGYKF